MDSTNACQVSEISVPVHAGECLCPTRELFVSVSQFFCEAPSLEV